MVRTPVPLLLLYDGFADEKRISEFCLGIFANYTSVQALAQYKGDTNGDGIEDLIVGDENGGANGGGRKFDLERGQYLKNSKIKNLG